MVADNNDREREEDAAFDEHGRPEFRDRGDLERWLDQHQHDVSVAVATRAALRTLPLLAGDPRFDGTTSDADRMLSAVVLPVLWALCTSWAAAVYPARLQDLGSSANRAANAISYANLVAAVSAAEAAAMAAASAASYTYTTFEPLTYAAEAVDTVISTSIGDYALRGLMDDVYAAHDGIQMDVLSRGPLWLFFIPDPAERQWKRLRSILLSAGDDWDVWVDWYEARLRGDPAEEDLEISRATLPDELWKEGPAAVNARIKELVAEHEARKREREPESPEALLETLVQDPAGATIDLVDGQLGIVATTQPGDIAAAGDALTIANHAEVRRKAKDFAERARRCGNRHGWERLPRAAERLEELVSVPTSDIPARIIEVWSASVSLGSLVDQDTAARAGQAGMVEPLEPDLRAELEDLMMTVAPWVRRFPTARQQDDEARQWQSERHDPETVRILVEDARKREILRAKDASLIEDAAMVGEGQGLQARKAEGWALRTTRNLAVAGVKVAGAMLGIAGAAYVAQVGTGIAEDAILYKRIHDWVITRESEIFEVLDGVPADLRAAVREILERLKKLGGDTPATPPPAAGRDI